MARPVARPVVRPVARLGLTVLLCLCLTPSAWAKPKGCFTKSEHLSERMIRHGIFLRETARNCQESPYSLSTQPMWEAVDKANGARFKAETERRRKAFSREFGEKAEGMLQVWDGRIVMHYRHLPLTVAQCEGGKKMLEDAQKRGWKALKTQAEKSRNEVFMDYRICD